MNSDKKPASKGLGRGLSALINTNKLDTEGQAPVSPGQEIPYHELPLSQITGNPRQPRTIFDDDTLNELAESIRAVGLVQPVVVRQRGDGYELVAGERRWRAARIAGLETVPALIREAGDAESLELALIENISREDLNPIDTARAYANLQEDYGITQETLSSKLGRSRSAVTNTLRLLDLPDEVQQLIEQGKLTEGHGRALLSVSDRTRQRKLARKIVKGGLSVRRAELLAKKEDAPGRKQKEPQNFPVGQELMDETTDALYSAFRLPVKVRWTGKGGRIEMEFSSTDELDKLIGVLEQEQ